MLRQFRWAIEWSAAGKLVMCPENDEPAGDFLACVGCVRGPVRDVVAYCVAYRVHILSPVVVFDGG